MSLTAPKPRWCRICNRGEPAVRFAGMARAICAACQGKRKTERYARRDPARSVKPARRPRPGQDLAHLAWIRTLPCAVARPGCGSRVHAHHVRLGTDGGTGLKPSDRWAVPICAAHHLEIHNDGQRTFEARYSVNLRAVAEGLAASSPSAAVYL